MKTKKILKITAAACLAGALLSGSLAVAGCGWTTQTVEGEYHYTNYGVDYGVKVNVEIQTDDKGDRIRKVTIADSEYKQLSDANPDYGWTDENRQNYLDNEQSLLNAYRGLYVADVLAMTASTNAAGEPSSVSDSAVVISGATQSSGRLLLAVQDALKQFGYSVCEGEYSYLNPWSPSSRYGIAVKVILKGDTIAKVVTVDSAYEEVSSGWEDKNIWTSGLAGLLESYAGKTRSEILAVNVTTDANGQPSAVSDATYVITGATQGSGRLMLAVQNALRTDGQAVGTVYEGEYHYTNYGTEYGVKVNVTVNGGVITKVAIADSDYTQLSPANPDYGWTDENRQNYLDNEDKLLAAYMDKTVGEVLAMSVTTNDNGEPSGVSDSSVLLSGATQSSGRLLLAVQNALSKIEGYSVCEGEYHYTNYGVDYGVKVKVALQGDTIMGLAIAPSSYTQLSPANPDYGWTDENRQNYLDNEASLLKAYIGKNVQDVLLMSVTTNDNGEPSSVSDDSVIISGATQSSGRLLLAVQNAISSLGNYQLCEGEYSYTNYGTQYGVKVKVLVQDGAIVKVAIAPSSYTQLSPANPDYGWTDENRQNYLNNEQSLLNAYSGKKVQDILAMSVATDNIGQPTSVSDSSLLISGATQSSGRLLLAVQNALGKL